jgi:glycolate oxidase iron-sulfur subunit
LAIYHLLYLVDQTLSPNPVDRPKSENYLKNLDYSVLQQCMHCGMCLPTCPTYVMTGKEKNSPRGRISLMRSIADDELEVTKAFADEMYFCLGCLACTTACPAGVDYAHLFEMARAEAERQGVLDKPKRNFIRWISIRVIFTRPRLLHLIGKLLWFYQAAGLQTAVRKFRLTRLLPKNLRELEPLTPTVRRHFSTQLIKPVESPASTRKYRVGLLTGCVQDLTFSDINRDTADVLLANHCEVVTPRLQPCCGSLHGHNGEWELARELARRNIDKFDLESLDAIITNAAGCGSHLKHYDRLLENDPAYAKKAKEWSKKLRDIHEWLVEIGTRPPEGKLEPQVVTYHEACHLCHGQKITRQPRQLLKSIPGLELRELGESTWCCGSAGVYNITQPEAAKQLLDRKMSNVIRAGAEVVATANPGCMIQVQAGVRSHNLNMRVEHPISLLARAYRAEKK